MLGLTLARAARQERRDTPRRRENPGRAPLRGERLTPGHGVGQRLREADHGDQVCGLPALQRRCRIPGRPGGGTPQADPGQDPGRASRGGHRRHDRPQGNRAGRNARVGSVIRAQSQPFAPSGPNRRSYSSSSSIGAAAKARGGGRFPRRPGARRPAADPHHGACADVGTALIGQEQQVQALTGERAGHSADRRTGRRIKTRLRAGRRWPFTVTPQRPPEKTVRSCQAAPRRSRITSAMALAPRLVSRIV
jgi:hypothetical protein